MQTLKCPRMHPHIMINGVKHHSVWTKGFSPIMKTHVPESCRDLTYIAQVDELESWTLEQLIIAIDTAASNHAVSLGRPKEYYSIVACIAGGEAGVDMADVLSERLGLMSNGTQGDFAKRRDKKVQVRHVGI